MDFAKVQSVTVQDRILNLLGVNGATAQSVLAASTAAEDVVLDDGLVEPATHVWIDGPLFVTVEDGNGHSTAPIDEYTHGSVPGLIEQTISDSSRVLTLVGGQTYTLTFTITQEPLRLELLADDGTTVIRAVRYRDLDLRAGLKAQIRIVGTIVEGLSYDADGDGTFETPVAPTVDVSGPEAGDVDPPLIEVQRLGALGSSTVTLSATDAGSGVARMLYSLDGTHFQPYSVPLQVDALRTPVIYAFADDKVGNRSSLGSFILARSTFIPMIRR